MVRRTLGTGDAVTFPVQHDGRHRDFGLRHELLLDAFVGRVAWGVAEPMAVGVDDDVDEIWIVERGGRALVGRVIKMPIGRPQLPQQLAEFAAVGLKAGAAALGLATPAGMRPIRQRFVKNTPSAAPQGEVGFG
jgi:hypothetical protein